MTRLLSRRCLVPAALLALAAGLALAQPGTPRPGGGGRPSIPGAPEVPNLPSIPGQPGGGNQFIERLMAMDANGDGKLSRSEVPAQFADRNFDRFDTNADGFIDRAELENGAANVRGGGGGGGGGRMPLGRAMENIASAWRAINEGPLNAASQAADLEQAQAMQEAVVAAKAHAATARFPAEVLRHFDGDEGEARMEFREHLLETLEAAIRLEHAIMEGDAAAAREALSELAKMEEHGHDEFRRE